MNIRSIALIVVALAIAGAAAMMARSLVKQTPQNAEASIVVPETVMSRILVADKALSIGHIIEAVDLRWQSWPEEALSETYLQENTATLESLVGKVVRNSIVPGEPITNAKIIGPGQSGFLAAVLGKGMRAITVAINQTSGIAGFVFPGDQVDLILTHEVRVGAAGNRQVSETVLYNVRVLAVDQRTDDMATKPTIGQTVTLEVTPKIAEMIAVIRQIGTLSLSLRSLAQDEALSGPKLNPNFALAKPSFTYDSDVSVLLPKVGEVRSITLSRGSEKQNIEVGGTIR